MRKIVLMSVCLLAVLFAAGQKQGAVLSFDKTEHDFGSIPHKSKQVECTFEFTNEGSAPLVITKVVTSCTCTKADYPKKPVMPGQKGSIRVIYEPSKKEPGVFYKAVEVYSNSADAKRKTIVVRGKAC